MGPVICHFCIVSITVIVFIIRIVMFIVIVIVIAIVIVIVIILIFVILNIMCCNSYCFVRLRGVGLGTRRLVTRKAR